jgi:hypothetical protein
MTDDDDIQEYARPCQNCEYHRKRAQFWREEAYRQAGHPLPDCDEPWSPVSIGVDMTEAGAHVVGIYAMSDETSQIFYAKHHPAPRRTWVGLTDEDLKLLSAEWRIVYGAWMDDFAKDIEAKLKEKNT